MKLKNNDIRICTSCHFLFEGNPNYGCCPDCGKPTIRDADDKETAEYWYFRKIFAEAKPA